MANETVITVVGNLTGDPNLRYTTSGAAVVDFTVASTPRTFDKQSGQWKDAETLFLRCSAWREYAENIAESLSKGDRVIVQGVLSQQSYTAKDGTQKTSFEVRVDEVGPVLRYARAQVTRASKNLPPPHALPSTQKAAFVQPAEDPWATPAQDHFPISQGQPAPSETPF